MGGSGDNGVGREPARARVGSRSPRKALAGILGCCPNKLRLSGPRSKMTLVVERGVARHVQDQTAEIEHTGTIPELIAHAIGLTTTPPTG